MQQLFFIVILFISLPLFVVIISGLFDFRYFACYFVDALLYVDEAVFELKLAGLFDVKQEFID